MSILDAALMIGRPESTYGTPVALTRGYEAQSDAWKRKVAYVDSLGFRAGLQALRVDRSKQVNMGAEGSIECDFLDRGMGLLLADAFGSVTGPTLVSGTTYSTIFQTNAAGPTGALTVQLLRPFVDGSTAAFTYAGSVVTGIELIQEVDKYLRVKVDYHSRNEDVATGAGTPVYPANSAPFQWDQVSTSTVGATAIDFKKITCKIDYKMNTERRFLKASFANNAAQKQPRLAGMPEITGELEAEFESMAEYNRFIAGTIMAGQFVWTGALIEGALNYKLTLDIAAMQYTGDTPEMSMSEMPKIALPYRVMHDLTNPAVKFTYQSNSNAH